MSVLIMIAVVDKNPKLCPLLIWTGSSNQKQMGGWQNLKPLHFTDLNDIWGSTSWGPFGSWLSWS